MKFEVRVASGDEVALGLTPETEAEKALVKLLGEKSRIVRVEFDRSDEPLWMRYYPRAFDRLWFHLAGPEPEALTIPRQT